MKFEAFFSSSRGNLYCVTAANGQRLLIDPGVTWKKLVKALNYDLSNIAGCLVSHEHADHSRAVEDVLMAGIDVYASAGTLDALGFMFGRDVINRKAHVIEDGMAEIKGGFVAFPFAVQHDAVEPLGFVIHDHTGVSCESLLFVTDTSHIKQRFGLAFNIIAICANYDKAVLQARVKAKDINEEFAKRLLTSHMEWRETKRYIKEFCCLDKCTEIWLLHTSGDNIATEAVRAEFEKDFFTKTSIAGQAARSTPPSSRTGPPAILEDKDRNYEC